MLEAMYRAQGGDKVGRLPMPYPNSPPAYPQRYPFLSPAMLSPPVNQVPFDLLRPPSAPQPPKSFGDTAGNKMKDRYACKFCGKVRELLEGLIISRNFSTWFGLNINTLFTYSPMQA